MKQLFFAIIFLTCQNLLGQSYPEMIKVEGGSFTMGNNNGDDEERPAHTVTVGSFSMSRYEITVAEYKTFCTASGRAMPNVPDWVWNDKHPMVFVSFNDAYNYCEWLSKTTGESYRLPTEAEWEYAARGGNKSHGYRYAGSDDFDEVGFCGENLRVNDPIQPKAVGRKKPNELGLYDMSGNVWEWCQDLFGNSYYENSPSNNPEGPSYGNDRVLRGGSFRLPAHYSWVHARNHKVPGNRDKDIGFRVVLLPQ